MSEALAEEENGAKFYQNNGDSSIENLKKDVKIKNEPLGEEDFVVKEENKEDFKMKLETKIKEEPIEVKIKFKSLEDDENGRVKKECDEGIHTSMDVEIKKEPLDGEGKDIIKKVEIKDESDSENESDEEQSENESDEEQFRRANYRESDTEDEEIDYPYVNAIRNSLDMVARLGTFACGEILEKAKLKLSVKGVGEIKLPLSYRQGEILKNKACTIAPYGKGSKTLVDKNVRDAWQVDAKDVTLDKTFGKLIKDTITEIIKNLGESSTENQKVVSELYKLVYYEKGGHFVAHRDTEKAPGMFATLVIQLPAGHEGGELIIRHKGETKVFNFEVDSRDNYYYTAFFADCEHELKRIIGGHRLVLIYNLIRENPHSMLNLNSNDNTELSKIESFVSTMKNSVEEWESDNKGPLYLALKLDHLYTDTNISFQHLKGSDKKKADAMCLCEDIKVYLATITKDEPRLGYNDGGDYAKGYEREFRPDPELAPKFELDEDPPTYKLDNWIGVNNIKPCFGERKLHKNQMLLKEEEMFSEEDERCGSEYEYTGNAGCNINFFYKKRALIFLPKSFELLMSCDTNLGSVLVDCKKLSKSKMDDALEMFKGIMLYIENKHVRAMSQLKYGNKVTIILKIMILFENTTKYQAKTFLLSLVKPFGSRYSSEKVGLPNIKSAITLAKLINKLSWETLGISVLQLVKESAISQTKSCVQLINSLLSLERHEQAIRVVEVAASQIIGQNDDLSIEGQGFQTFLSIWQQNNWKNLSLKAVIVLLPIVLSENTFNFDKSLLINFVHALIEHEHSNNFLKEILKLPNVVEEKDNSLVQLIVTRRLQQLDVPYPVFSWAMPNALQVTNSTTVGISLYNFLKSDEQSKTFVGVFENKRHADRFGEKYFGYRCDNSKYSAKYETSGRGSTAQCKVIKTKEYFNSKVKQYNLDLEEATFLKKNFGESKITVSRKRSRE